MQRCAVLRRVLRLALVLAIASGCVRAPALLDVTGLVKVHGEAGARGELEVRILDDPRDVQARLALATLADRGGRPTQAIEQLEAVLRLGGPIGTRWHDEDRARFARLVRARGMVRLQRRAATAFADLERARSFGAVVDAVTLAEARSLVAIDQLRHVDGRTRAAGQRTLAELRGQPFADASWVGALADATPRDRGLFGVWLWRMGAKRAAYEALAAWRATTAERDVATSPLHAAYLRALAWWTPIEGALPPVAELVGPARCWFVACSPAEVLEDRDAARRSEAVAAMAVGPRVPATERDAAAWASILLEAALVDGTPWGAYVARRVHLGRVARIAGQVAAGGVEELSPWQRLLVAFDRVLAGGSRAQVSAALGEQVDTPVGKAVLAILDPSTAPVVGAPRSAAIAAYLARRGLTVVETGAIVAAFLRDPAIADRLARDVVARAPDAAVANAALGTMWSLLDDPARARMAWEAAVEASSEPAFVRGLAEAVARAGDADAAMVHGTAAAAAAGDPAIVWTSLSRTLQAVGRHQHALEAARSAIDLAGREALPEALDAATAASRSMGRTKQVDALVARRAKVAPPIVADVEVATHDDPTDAQGAIAAYQRRATASSIARMWVASRWNPHDVTIRAVLLEAIAVVDDPRRVLLIAELVALAGSADDERARAAVRAVGIR